MSENLDVAAFVSSMHTLEGGIYNAGAQAMRASVKAAEDSAKGTTLYSDVTGKLRSRTTGTADGLKGKLVADTKYAYWVENGTRPHVIQARRGGVLAFVVNGQQVFAKRVNHPGTAERPFMTIARDVGEQTLEYGLDYLTSEAIARSR